jgi:uncharacterized membrane protein
MWTRSELKHRAKNVLRTTYWKAFLVSLLLAFITGGIPSCSFNSGFGGGRNDGGSTTWSGVSGGFGDLDGAFLVVLVIIIIIAVLAVLAAIAFRVFLCNPLIVGVRQYFKQAAQDDANMNYLGYAFAKGKYMAVVKAMFWSGFLNFLWFLLLIIPGFVKMYAYSMVPYILADNANIGSSRAVELSNRMTRGHKWRIFVLDLSFIGWYLLGTIAFLVGVLFVLPYINATKAELYLAIRQEALDEGLCSRAELGLPDLV